MSLRRKRKASSARQKPASAPATAKTALPSKGRNWKLVLSVVGLVATIAVLASWLQRKESELSSPPDIESTGTKEIDPAVVEAVRVARQRVIDNPKSPDLWGHLGMVFAAHAFDDSAATCFAAASSLVPSNQRWAYLHARCKLPSAPEESLSLLEHCADLAGDPLDTPRLFLIEKLLEDHQLDDAEKHLNRSLAKNPKNARTRFAKARLHFLREEYKECKNEIISTHRDIKRSYETAVQQAKVLAAEGRAKDSKLAINDANQLLRTSFL